MIYIKNKRRILVIIGNNVRRLRMIKGLSQEKLGLKIGLHRNYVGQLERGEVNISILNLELVAKELGVGIVDLLIKPNIPKKG